MSSLKITWDSRKAIVNQKKHGVSFEEARTVFLDDRAIEFFDEKHSEIEPRFLLLGMSFHLRILMIAHCHREESGVIRIISARRATKSEAAHYWRQIK